MDHERGMRRALIAAARSAQQAEHPKADQRQRLALLGATAQWVLLAEDFRLRRQLKESSVRQRVLAADLEAGRAGALALPAQEPELLGLLGFGIVTT